MKGWLSQHKVAGTLTVLVGVATSAAVAIMIANNCSPDVVISLKERVFPRHTKPEDDHPQNLEAA